MPDVDKQKKKENIEKLRMIIDNPRGTQALSKDDKYLDSVRRRLGGVPASKSSSSHPDFLKPQVTIHGPDEKPLSSRQPVYKEPCGKPLPSFVEKKREYEDVVDVKDLYDVEKIEYKEPSTPEWKPVETTTEQKIPSWIAVEVAPPKPEPLVEKPKEQVLQEWIPVEVVTPKPEPLVEKPKSIGKQPEHVIPRIVRDGKLDVFKELHSVDPPTAELLYEKGFTSVESLRASSVETLVRYGIEKRVSRTIKKELVQLDKKKAKQLKKAAKVTVSIKTEHIDKSNEIRPQIPKTPAPVIKRVEEELPVWESVEVTESYPKKKTPLLIFKKKEKPKKITEKKKPVSTKVKAKKSPPKKKKESTSVVETKPVIVVEKKERPPLFKRRVKKEITVKETIIDESEEWVRKPDRGTVKKPVSTPIPTKEWEHPSAIEVTPKPIIKKEEAYQFGEYSLYKKEIETADGKLRTIHFFSKTPLQHATPATLPEGFEVVVNKKTGLPFLKKITP